jgi:hypothetical protein
MATQYVPNILSQVSIYHKMYNYMPNILSDVKMNITTHMMNSDVKMNITTHLMS